MIRINTCHLRDGAREYEGTESSSILDLAAPLKPDGAVTYRLFASMAGKDLVVRGKARVFLEAECARCLTAVRYPLTAEDLCIVRENVPEQEVDITDEIREELLLALPVRFLCSDDCKGLCPVCGADRNRETCACGGRKKPEPPPENSPWAVLDQLKSMKKRGE